jgi:hypothetical protein
MDIDTFGTLCFTTIGQAPCVCFAKNCGTSHQGAIIRVKRGELVVSKNPTTVFGEPRIDASFLSDGLMEEWMTKSLTLEDWEALFRSAIATREEESEVTAAGMEAQQNFLRRKPMPTGLQRPNVKGSHWRFQPPSGSHLTSDSLKEKKALSVWIRNPR